MTAGEKSGTLGFSLQGSKTRIISKFKAKPLTSQITGLTPYQVPHTPFFRDLRILRVYKGGVYYTGTNMKKQMLTISPM